MKMAGQQWSLSSIGGLFSESSDEEKQNAQDKRFGLESNSVDK